MKIVKASNWHPTKKYELEKILKESHSGDAYLVRWKGYSSEDDSWQDKEDMERDNKRLVDEFKEKRAVKKKQNRDYHKRKRQEQIENECVQRRKVPVERHLTSRQRTIVRPCEFCHVSGKVRGHRRRNFDRCARILTW